VPILGTTPDAIDLAEDRERFSALLRDRPEQPVNAVARTPEEAFAAAEQVGYPDRDPAPSYVLGGRAMEIVRDDEQLGPLRPRRRAGCPATARC
jgi:carbamoyl-phosphate synthase large subunit